MYDVSNRSTFSHLETWFDELSTYSADGVVKMIVGNKNDKHGRDVSYQEGEALAAKVHSYNRVHFNLIHLLHRWKLSLLKRRLKRLLECKMPLSK